MKRMVFAVALLAAASWIGYAIGQRGASGDTIPNSWVGHNQYGAYLIAWTQTDDRISGALSEGGGCSEGGADNPLTGTVNGTSITIHVNFGYAVGSDYTRVGTVSAARLTLPSFPVLRPGSSSDLGSPPMFSSLLPRCSSCCGLSGS